MMSGIFFWVVVALVVGVLLSNAYRGNGSRATNKLELTGLKLPKVSGALMTGKALKLGLLLGVVLFIEFYPWLEKWGKVTPMTFITGKLAEMEEANREFILMLVHLLPWVIAGFIAWNILIAAPAATGTEAKQPDVLRRTYNAFLVTLVGLTLISVIGYFFAGTSGDVPSGETVEFNLVQHESVSQAVGINTPIRLIIPRSPVSARGEIRSAGCAKVVSPEVAVLMIKGDPVEILSPNQGRVFNMRLSEGARDFLAKNQIPYIRIKFYRRQFNIETEPECP